MSTVQKRLRESMTTILKARGYNREQIRKIIKDLSGETNNVTEEGILKRWAEGK